MGLHDLLLTHRRRARDPAESWELVFSEAEGGSWFRATSTSHPYTPRREEDIAPGAWAALRDTCGLDDLHQVFIIPWAVRSIGLGNRKVISPNSVLAIGGRAVALWTEKPRPGIRITIPLDEVAAIEDVTILLYGRLSFVPFGQQLTIRYNTVARQALEPVLLELRRKLSGPALSVPSERDPAPVLPFKWHNLIRSAQVRMDHCAPVAFRFHNRPRRSRRDHERGELLVLNPWELVYLCDPPDSLHQYGEDSFIIPRARMSDVRVDDKTTSVTSNGACISLGMAPALSRAAVQWCSGAGEIGHVEEARRADVPDVTSSRDGQGVSDGRARIPGGCPATGTSARFPPAGTSRRG
jgi:hypothetical protein